jgi:hypothetical protein
MIIEDNEDLQQFRWPKQKLQKSRNGILARILQMNSLSSLSLLTFSSYNNIISEILSIAKKRFKVVANSDSKISEVVKTEEPASNTTVPNDKFF